MSHVTTTSVLAGMIAKSLEANILSRHFDEELPRNVQRGKTTTGLETVLVQFEHAAFNVTITKVRA